MSKYTGSGRRTSWIFAQFTGTNSNTSEIQMAKKILAAESHCNNLVMVATIKDNSLQSAARKHRAEVVNTLYS